MHDALAALAAPDGEELTPPARETAELLALVAGEDVAQGDDGVFRIVRGGAADRVISTLDLGDPRRPQVETARIRRTRP